MTKKLGIAISLT